MPFDGVPEGLVSDLVKLRLALDGVRGGWLKGQLGHKNEDQHCAIGWLLEATDWNRDETVRLALQYVYPALPLGRQYPKDRLHSIVLFNDTTGRKRIAKLFEDAVRLAEQHVMVR